MADQEPEAEPGQHGLLGHTAWLLVAAAVIAALIGVRASLVGSNGSNYYDQAIRQDVQRGAALTEDVRFVYSEEAPSAFQVAEARVRAQELRKAARGKSGLLGDYLRSEAAAQDKLAATIEPTHPLTAKSKYRRPDDSYDVFTRLADQRKENPKLLHLNPDATQKQGSDNAKQATLFAAATIPAAFAFLFGSLTEGFPRRRRPLMIAGYAALAVSVLFALAVEVAL